MTYREAAPRTTRQIPASLVAGWLVVAAAIGATAFLTYPWLSSVSSPALASPPASSSLTAASPISLLRVGQPGAPGELGGAVDTGATLPRRERAGAPDESDGVVADGVTIFDDQHPAVLKLDPGLLQALRRAATDAAGAGITFYVDSGWRSTTYQEQLFREAVSEYGSAEQAARWVAIPGRSTHESGNAVDIGEADATAWLSDHGAGYGLCQIYRNEPWHFELRPDAIDLGCPRLYADATHDPRMQP